MLMKKEFTKTANAFDAVESRIAVLNKRAKKLKLEPISLDIVDAWVEGVRGKPMSFVKFTVTGDWPVVKSDLELVGVVDKGEGGGNVVRAKEDLPLDLRSAELRCDHCNKVRRRNRSIVLKSKESGEYLLIGSSCIKDFIGKDLKSVIEWTSEFDSLITDDGYENDYPEGSNRTLFNIREGIAVAYSLISKYGFKKSGNDDSTGVSFHAYFFGTMYRNERDSREWYKGLEAGVEKGRELADAVLEWASAIDADTANGFMFNAKSVLLGKYLDPKHVNIFVAAVNAFIRDMERAAEKAAEADVEKVELEAGRYEIRGKVVSTKWVDSYYGETFKMLVALEGKGSRVFGSVPESIAGEVDTGATVVFTATVEVSADDKFFGFFKRPAKASVESGVE